MYPGAMDSLGRANVNENPATFLRPPQLAKEISSYVRELILSGQLEAGAPQSIDRLGRELGVSSTPVREALLSLRGEGFITFEPRRGFRVSPLSRRDIQDLYWIQSEVAGELTGRVAENASADLVAEAVQVQAAMREAFAASRLDDVEGLNYEFHRNLYRAAESPKLLWLIGITVRYSPRRFYAMIPGWVEASMKDHDAVIDALQAHDPRAAIDAMRKHIDHAGKLLVQNLERRGFWDSPGADAVSPRPPQPSASLR
jgi:DNA-binding GntR family transcriptional regulator